jgi:hypothetical protein
LKESTEEIKMKMQFTLPDGEPIGCDIEITTEHSASSIGWAEVRSLPSAL